MSAATVSYGRRPGRNRHTYSGLNRCRCLRIPPGSPGTGIGSKELRETRLAANAVGFLFTKTRVYTPSMMNLIRVFPSLAIADQ
jgi:hypothetical protein